MPCVRTYFFPTAACLPNADEKRTTISYISLFFFISFFFFSFCPPQNLPHPRPLFTTFLVQPYSHITIRRDPFLTRLARVCLFLFYFSFTITAGASDSPPGLSTSQSGPGSGRKGAGGPPVVRPGLSEGLEGGSGRRTRLSLLDDLQEEEVRACLPVWRGGVWCVLLLLLLSR